LIIVDVAGVDGLGGLFLERERAGEQSPLETNDKDCLLTCGYRIRWSLFLSPIYRGFLSCVACVLR